MRLTTFLVALALMVPMAASAQSKKTTKKTTTTETSAPAAAEEPAQPARKQRESLHDQVSGQGYGLAGCGLGSIVFGPKPGMIQIVAATVNGTGVQTFGITTGTSNCDIPGMGHQAAAFIEVNREIVSKDAARGQGETVASLASILNCQDEAAFGQNLQTNYESIFATENNSYDVTRKIISTIEANPALKATCGIDG
ncbi:MAG: DUF3015 family protein [Bdellovibrionota bacterium]